MSKLLFPLGQIVATLGALALGVNFAPQLRMHATGLWRDVGQEDW